jgi:hypothetical protein
VEIGDEPARSGDDEENNEQAESKRQDTVCVIGPAAEMQKEDEMDVDL